MKKLLLLTFLLLTFCASARATEITIGSFSPGMAWRYGGSTATLRISNSQGFLNSDGVWIPQSTSTNFYKTVTCTIASSVITCPSFVLSSTVNGNPTSARYKFQFYGPGTANTARDVLWSNFQVPTILGTSITAAQLITFNQAAPAPPRPGFPDVQQVQTLINTAVGTLNDASTTVKGRTKLSVEPVSAANPIAAGDNDARVNSVVAVSAYKTGGVGTSGSPWTGWDTAITWTANTAYLFRDGYYAYSTSPNWAIQGIQLRGSGGAVLKFTGSGKAVNMVGAVQGSGAVGPSFVVFENLTIQGNAGTTHSLYVENVQRSYFDNIQAKDATTAAFEIHFSTSSTYRRLRHHYFNTTRPTNCLVTNQRNSGETVQETKFERIICEDTTGDAVVLSNTWQSEIDGTVQGNGGNGIVVNSTCENNRLHHLNIELNSGTNDILDNGIQTIIEGVLSNKLVTIGASSRFNVIDGGRFCSVTYTAGAKMPTVKGSPMFNFPSPNLGCAAGAITYVPGVNAETEFFNWATNTPSTAFWVFPVPANSWVDAPYIGYRRSGNTVYIEGGASGGTVAAGGTIVVTLDSQYWPVRDHRFVVSCGVSTAPAECAILINTAGEVKVLNVNVASAQAGLYFDGIHFKAYPYQ